MSENVSPLDIRTTALPDGSTRFDLIDAGQGGRSVSHIDRVVPFTLHVGAAYIPMAGIAGVGTEVDCRRRGYSSRVMRAALAELRARASEDAGDAAALSMLYGIRDFYPQFGYATAGAEHYIVLKDGAAGGPLPDGWGVRALTPGDLPAVRGLYERSTEGSVGATVRAPDGAVWSRLAAFAADGETAEGECRVVVRPDGRVAGYAWRGRGFWYVPHFERYYTPGALVIAEAAAEDVPAAVAVLAACRAWAEEGEEGNPGRPVTLPLPPEGPLAAAARLQSAEFVRRYSRCGNSMACVVNVGVLLRALLPELNARWDRRPSSQEFEGALRVTTDVGEATLAFGPNGITLAPAAGTEGEPAALTAALPQTAIARLALGAFPPADLWLDLPTPLSDSARQILETLFPERHPHMNLPDRY